MVAIARKGIALEMHNFTIALSRVIIIKQNVVEGKIPESSIKHAVLHILVTHYFEATDYCQSD